MTCPGCCGSNLEHITPGITWCRECGALKTDVWHIPALVDAVARVEAITRRPTAMPPTESDMQTWVAVMKGKDDE